MANKITDMSKIRKAIKFYCNGKKSKLFISKYLSLSRNTVKKYISLFETLGLSFEAINEKSDAELEVVEIVLLANDVNSLTITLDEKSNEIEQVVIKSTKAKVESVKGLLTCKSSAKSVLV